MQNRTVAHVIIWPLIVLVVGCALVEGLRLRHWVWETTAPIRFTPDIERGFYWGMQSSGPEGYLNQYEKMAIQSPDSDLWLDYAPLRLLVMKQWGSWVRSHYPQDQGWDPSFQFNQPVLRFNLLMDLIACLCAFFLTRL